MKRNFKHTLVSLFAGWVTLKNYHSLPILIQSDERNSYAMYMYKHSECESTEPFSYLDDQ